MDLGWALWFLWLQQQQCGFCLSGTRTWTNSDVSLNNVRKCLKWFTFPFFSLCRSTFGKLHVSWLKILGAHPNWKCFPFLPLTCPPSCVHCRQVVLFLTCSSFDATLFWPLLSVYICLLFLPPPYCSNRSPLWDDTAYVFLPVREKKGAWGCVVLGDSWVCYECKGCTPCSLAWRDQPKSHLIYRPGWMYVCPYQFPPRQIGSDDI